jgi:hypothetical protein
MADRSVARQAQRHGERTRDRQRSRPPRPGADGAGTEGRLMDPDVFITIAFAGYAVFAALGIGAVLMAAGRAAADEKREEEEAHGEMHPVRRRRIG